MFVSKRWILAALGLLLVGALAFSQGQPSSGPHSNYYVEPGTQEIPVKGGGTVQGKIWIDLETGDAYGFPVQGPRLPYPTWQTSLGQAQTVSPIYLGRFDVSQFRRSGGRIGVR